MNTLTLYVCPGTPCPPWPAQTSPCATSDMQVRSGRPRPTHTNSEKQKNERTNPIPPNSNAAMLVQRNLAAIHGAIDVKYPSILHSLHSELVLSRAASLLWVNIPPKRIQPVWVGANGCSPVCALCAPRRGGSTSARNEKQKNERTNPIPPNPNAAMLVQRNFAGLRIVGLPLTVGFQSRILYSQRILWD